MPSSTQDLGLELDAVGASLRGVALRALEAEARDSLLRAASQSLTAILRSHPDIRPGDFDAALRATLSLYGHELHSFSETKEWADYVVARLPGLCMRVDYVERTVEVEWAPG